MAKGNRGGKTGSGGTPGTQQGINSVREAKDLTELADFVQNKYNMRVDTQSFQNVDFESAKIAIEGVTMIIDEFPGAESMFKEINARNNRSNAFASASYNGEILINPTLFKTTDNINERYGRTTASKFHPEGTSAVHITSHEAGHILDRALIEKSITDTGYWGSYAKAEAWNKAKISGKVISEAAKNAKKTPGGKGKRNADLISEVSGYATHNRAETLAECVADYAANGSKAKPLSQEVWKILKRELG